MVDSMKVAKSATDVLKVAIGIFETLEPGMAPAVIAGLTVLQKLAGGEVPTQDDLAALASAREAKVADEESIFDAAAAKS